MSKSSYREYFANVRLYVRMNPFLKQARITESNFSFFMKGDAYDHLISVDKLDALVQCLRSRLLEIV